MGITTGGHRGNGSDGGKPATPREGKEGKGALLDMLIEPLAPNVDVQVTEEPDLGPVPDDLDLSTVVATTPPAAPPADRNASVIQLFPAGSPPATPSELKPYILEVTDGNGTTSATFETFDEAARAFVYRSQIIASLKYLADGQLTSLAWIEAQKDGAEAKERFANEAVRQAIQAIQRKKVAYGTPATPAQPPLPVPVPATSPAPGVIDQYKRILGGYNCRNGIYRGMFNIKVMEDHGNEILFHRTSEEATQACVALAMTKGWTAVEIGGTPERKERAWLAYTMAGIKVTNYSPPLHILERYQAMTEGRTPSANVDRPAGEAPAETEEVSPPVRMRAGG